MSNDTMPCGCEGHADNEGLCRYPALEQSHAEWKRRAEKAEAQLHTALEQVRQAFTARKVPTPGGGLAGILAAVEDLADRSERAEADNAALLDMLKRVDSHLDVSECCRAVRNEARGLMEGPHPGTALLERLRALEDAGGYVLRDAFRPQTPELVDANGERVVRVGWEWIERLRVALDKECEECGMLGAHKLQCGRRA